MIFCDSSAIVSFLLRQPGWDRLVEEIDKADHVLVWWGTGIECVSAIARLRRSNELDDAAFNLVMTRLDTIESNWLEVPPIDELRDVARRVLFAHTLRAADALQLAAALFAAGDRIGDLAFVCLDQRLCEAARKEGFSVLP